MQLPTRLEWLFRRDRSEQDLDEELRAHLEISTDENIGEGMSPEEARHAARRAFGNVTLARESTRDVWVFGWLESLWQDARYGVRTLAKCPGFTIVALLSLALGIGATTAIFSIFDAVWLRPLPHENAGRLVAVSEVELADPDSTMGVALGNFTDWREQCTAFENLSALHWSFSQVLLGGEQAEMVLLRRASKGYYEMVGAKVVLGRLFLPEDFVDGAPLTAVLSHGLWQRMFGSDPNIVGKTLSIYVPMTVVGVMSPDYQTLAGTPIEVWLPMGEPFRGADNRRGRNAMAIGLLKEGVDARTAQSELDLVAARLAEQYPDQEGMGARIEPLRDHLYGHLGGRLAIFFAAVGFLLLIACANVASLLLVRAASREKEMAVRGSLGASRPRLVRQLLVEGALLSVAGAAFGLLLAFLGVKLLVGIYPAMVPRADAIALNLNVLGFALLIAILSTLLFGLAPALGASKPNLNESLKETGRPATTRFGGRRAHSVLVVAEIALSLVLLIGVALMAHSVWRVLHIDIGFDEENLATLMISLPRSEYLEPQSEGGFRVLPKHALALEQIRDRLEALPGVVSASVADLPPVRGCLSRVVSVGDQPLPSRRGDAPITCLHAVSPDHFRTLRVPLLKGRQFNELDNETSPAVAIISQGLAARYFPDQDPIGKVLNIGDPSRPRNELLSAQVVGVAPDVRQNLLRPPFAAVYMPYSQQPIFVAGPASLQRTTISFVVRTAVEPESLRPTMRRVVAEADPNIVILQNDTISDVRALYLRSSRFYTWLLAVFAGIAVVLTAVGLHGVMSYAVTRRTHEIGVRLALGARRRDVMRLILRQGLLMTVLGLGIGLAGARALTRFLAAQLYEVEPTDPTTFAVTAIVLCAVALVASFLPAWRAAQLNPNEALRYE